MLIEHFPYGAQKTFEVNRQTACPFDWPSLELWPNMVSVAYHSRPSGIQYISPLSITCVFNGQAQFQVDGKHGLIDDHSYFIVNSSQRVTSYVEPNVKLETFCVAFQPAFVDESFAAIIAPEDQLLDAPHAHTEQPVYFFDKAYNHDDLVTPILHQLRNAAAKGKVSRTWFEERFYTLVERMLSVHRNIRSEVDRLSAARLATRVEIYRRLHRARDFIDACTGQNLTLAQMAEQAFLSPYHFSRLFKEAFGETPYQYLTRQRLNRAKALVLKTDKSITEICCDVGFESLGSFSWLFRRHFEVPPSKLRS